MSSIDFDLIFEQQEINQHSPVTTVRLSTTHFLLNTEIKDHPHHTSVSLMFLLTYSVTLHGQNKKMSSLM